MAYHCGGEPSCVRDISRRQAISPRYLEQIFQALRRGGLLKSRRGPKGGYYLARPLSEVTVADIVRAAEGSLVRPSKRRGRKQRGVPVAEEYLSKAVWGEVQGVIQRELEGITLETLCEGGKEAGLPSELEKRVMYFI